MEKEKYLENKAGALDVLNYFYKNSKTPFVSGTSRLFEYNLLKASNLEIFLSFVATALFQIEKMAWKTELKNRLRIGFTSIKKACLMDLLKIKNYWMRI